MTRCGHHVEGIGFPRYVCHLRKGHGGGHSPIGGRVHRWWLSRRLRIYLEPRDAWVGAYVAKNAVYVCPVPFLVFRWRRGGTP
jgi:hypothetical protein